MASTDTATSSDPNVDVTLKDEDGTVVGLIVVDQTGARNFKAISRQVVPRTPFKITSGEHKYADFEFPFVQIAQTDWSEGGGQETFENNRNKFRTSWAMDSWHNGRIFLGPRDVWMTGDHRVFDQDLPGDVAWEEILNGTGQNMRYVSVAITPSSSYTSAGVSFWIRGHDGNSQGSVMPDLEVYLCADDGTGKPDFGSQLATGTYARSSYADTELEFTSLLIDVSWDTPYALTSGTTVHLVLDGGVDTKGSNGHWLIGTKHGGSGTYISSTTTAWTTTGLGGFSTANTFSMYYRTWEAKAPFEAHLFNYKKAAYFIANYDDGSTPKLFVNGYRGIAAGSGQTSTTLKDKNASWAVNELAGKVVEIVDGTGKGQSRTILSNTATIITVDTAWDKTPVSASSWYVIKGLDTWNELTGHGLTGPVTDVDESNGIIFVCQGDATAIQALRATATGSTFADVGTVAGNKYTLTGHTGEFIATPLHPEQGEIIAVTSGNQTVKGAKFPSWGSVPTFKFETKIRNSDSRFTGLELGGENRSQLVAFKEDGIYVGATGGFEMLPIDGMDKVTSLTNGKGHAVVGPYVYYSFMGSVERLHLGSKQIDDLGPDKGTGLPDDRRGTVVDMLVYPGAIIMAIDGGADNYSSVMLYNMRGFHTLYKAHNVGDRIRKLSYQQIEGLPDRLYVSIGSDVIHLNFPSNGFDPTNDTQYKYTHEGVLDTSYISGGLEDLRKHFVELGVFAKNMRNGNLLQSPWNERNVYVANRQDSTVNDTETWQSQGDAPDTTANTSKVTYTQYTVNTVIQNVLTGFKNQNRIILRSDQAAYTPEVTAIVQKHASFVEAKYAWTFLARIQDQNIDLQGDESAETSSDLLTTLDAWAGTPEVLIFNSRFASWGASVRVYLSALTLQPFRLVEDDDIEGYIAQFEITEVN